jgi:enterobactin synthetase component F
VRRPLTAAQRGIWFAQQLDPASHAFVTADCVAAPAAVDAERLAAAVGRALGEAEGLHARLGEQDGVPWQELPDGPVGVRVPVLDVASPEAAGAWMEADRARPFDLAAGSLSRQAVLRIPGEGVWWYQAIHHLATDAYATSLLLRRAAEHYDGTAGPSRFRGIGALLDLDAAYDPAADAAYWRAALAGVPAATGPAGRAVRPSGRTLRVARALGSELAAPGVLAACALWLHRVTGAEEVVLGLPVMGRLGSAAARVPACWVNLLPLRVDVAGAASLGALRARVAADVKAATRHGRRRYEDLRRDLGLLGDDRRLVGPLVNIKPFARGLRLGAAEAEIRNLAAGPVEDLSVFVLGDRLVLEGAAELYDADALAAHADRLALALDGVARHDAAAPVRAVRVLRPADRRAELAAAWGERVDVPAATLWSRFAAQASRTPDAVAVRDATTSLRYAELHATAEALAGRLAARGAGPGEVVGVALDRSAALLGVLLAILRTGAAYLPLEPDGPAARREAMLADARPVLVVDDPHLGGPSADPGPGPTPDDLAYVIYTSGSTGAPKGVEVAHRAIVNRLAWQQHAFGLRPGERVLLKTPLGFDVSVWELFWAHGVGGTLVVAPPGAHRDPRALAELIRAEDVHTAHFVPSMLRAFLDEPAAAACTGLRRVVCSGEALPADLAARCAERLPGAVLENLYGPTEAAVDVTHWRVVPGARGPVPIGRPVWNTGAFVLDPQGDLAVPGAPGELHLAGVQLARGYRGRPDLTAERFGEGPDGVRAYRTGDLARRRGDGALEYLGRIDGQVKVRGVRIEPGEVEAVLAGAPGVGAVAVVAYAPRPGETALAAYVTPADADAAAVRAHAAARLPDAMVPAAVVALDALPVGPTGKLDRRALPAPPRDPGGRPGGEAPRTPVEERLCAIFAAVLGVERVGAGDGFFDLGGHSLLAARLVRRIRAELGVDVGLGAVFAAPTPAALAARIASGRTQAREPVLRLRGGDGPPLVCVHPAGGLGWCYAALAARLPEGVPVLALQADGTTHPTLDDLAAAYVARAAPHVGDGPWHLLGWSVGGVIAHAMAARLEAAGAEVGLLALLDAYPAEAWRGLAPPGPAEALRALEIMGGLDPAEGEPTLAGVVARLRAAGSALATLGPDALAAVAASVVHTAGLMRAAEHRPVDADVTFFTAAAPRAEAGLDRGAWAAHVRGAIRNHDLPCTHAQLVVAPAVDAIAAQVARTAFPSSDSTTTGPGAATASAATAPAGASRSTSA